MAVVAFGGLGLGCWYGYSLIFDGRAALGLLVVVGTAVAVLTSGGWLAPAVAWLTMPRRKDGDA